MGVLKSASLVFLCIISCSCSNVSKLDQNIIEINSLLETPQDLVNKFYQNDATVCRVIKLESITASLHPHYNLWEQSRWSKEDKADLMSKWQTTFKEAFEQEFRKQGVTISNEQPCLIMTADVYDIQFGNDVKQVGNFKRENTGFDMPLYSAKLRIKLLDSDSPQVYALLIDYRKTNFPSIIPYRFEIDPEKTIEFIYSWANTSVNLLCKYFCYKL